MDFILLVVLMLTLLLMLLILLVMIMLIIFMLIILVPINMFLVLLIIKFFFLTATSTSSQYLIGYTTWSKPGVAGYGTKTLKISGSGSNQYPFGSASASEPVVFQTDPNNPNSGCFSISFSRTNQYWYLPVTTTNTSIPSYNAGSNYIHLTNTPVYFWQAWAKGGGSSP